MSSEKESRSEAEPALKKDDVDTKTYFFNNESFTARPGT